MTAASAPPPYSSHTHEHPTGDSTNGSPTGDTTTPNYNGYFHNTLQNGYSGSVSATSTSYEDGERLDENEPSIGESSQSNVNGTK